MRKVLAIIVSAVLALGAASPALAKSVPEATRDGVGMDVSGFSSQDLGGNPVTGEILNNAAVTVFNYWATWCGPCQMEMPYFQQAHEYYSATPEADVQIYSILLEDSTSTVAAAQAFLSSHGYTWPNIRLDQTFYDVIMSTSDGSGVSIPQTIFVDSSGIIHRHHIGMYSSYEQLDAAIRSLLDELAAPAVPGDVDDDGSVTISDAVTVLRMAMGLVDESSPAADINGNGTVDVSDAVSVLRLAMGL